MHRANKGMKLNSSSSCCWRPVLSDGESSEPRGLGRTPGTGMGVSLWHVIPRVKENWKVMALFVKYFLLGFLTPGIILHRCPALFVKYWYSQSFSAPPHPSQRGQSCVPNQRRNLFESPQCIYLGWDPGPTPGLMCLLPNTPRNLVRRFGNFLHFQIAGIFKRGMRWAKTSSESPRLLSWRNYSCFLAFVALRLEKDKKKKIHHASFKDYFEL